MPGLRLIEPSRQPLSLLAQPLMLLAKLRGFSGELGDRRFVSLPRGLVLAVQLLESHRPVGRVPGSDRQGSSGRARARDATHPV